MALGDILIVGTQTRKIYRYNGSSWDAGLASPSTETVPAGLAVDPSNGDLLVVGSVTDKIYRYSGGSWNSGLSVPSAEGISRGLAIDTNGDLLVVGLSTGKIYRYSSGSWNTGLARPSGSGSLQGLAVDPSNRDILVLAGNTRKVYRYHNSTWDSGLAIPSAETQPEGVAIDTNGDILVVGRATDKIYRYHNSTWDAGTAVPSGENHPRGLTVDTFGEALAASFPGLAGSYTINVTTYLPPKALGATFAGIAGSYTLNVNKLVALAASFPGSQGTYALALTKLRAPVEALAASFPGSQGTYALALTKLRAPVEALAASFPGKAGSYEMAINVISLEALNATLPGVAGSYTLNVNKVGAPGAPQTIGASIGNQRATFYWSDAPEGNSPIEHYEYRLDKTGNWVDIPYSAPGPPRQANANSYTVPNLPNKASVVFEVLAVNDIGKGGIAEVTITPSPVPNAPVLRSAVPRDSQVELTWEYTATGEAAALDYEYQVDTSPWIAAHSLNNSIVISGLTNGQTYSFKVRAINSVGHSVASNTLTSTPLSANTPRSLAVSAGSNAGEVSLMWTAPPAADDPLHTWDELDPLHTGLLVASPLETNRIAEGSYTLGIKAVDTSENESRHAKLIQVALEERRVEGLDGEDGNGVEYVFAATASSTQPPVGSRPLASWTFDQTLAAPIKIGTVTYSDGAPTDFGATKPYLHRYSRRVLGAA